MPTLVHPRRRCAARPLSRRPRRGIALVFVLIFVIAMAALAMSSIFMASNANLLAKSYDRERDLKFAAEAALAIGKSRVNADPSILVMRRAGQLDTAILLNYTIRGADGLALPGITVNVYVGPTGSTSGQFGRFSSIVAEARDQRGNGFIRRLELTQESFAKFAYWSNSENSSTGGIIYFNNGDQLFGPVWSNDTINIGSGGANFRDEVGTVFFIAGAGYGTFAKGYKINQTPIPLPSLATLSNLTSISATSGWNFRSTSSASNNETSVRDRIEFVAMDLNGNGDSLDLNEGMFRIFTARSDQILRGDYPAGNAPTRDQVTYCGDYHTVRIPGQPATSSTLQFFPASIHNQVWFFNQIRQDYQDKNPGWTAAQLDNAANVVKNEGLNTVMTNPNARCYLPGDPHLVAIERNGPYRDPATPGVNYAAAAIQKGGLDSTWTPIGTSGTWLGDTMPINPAITLLRRDAAFLFPIDRGFNSNAKGVIHFDGNVGLSGTVNGRITMYANGSIVLLDDLRYANDPVRAVCRDILGIISDRDIVIADNALNTPEFISNNNYNSLDDTPDVTIHAVMMALGNSFRVENFNGGPTAVNNCGTTTNGRGCISLSGGIIQRSRGAVGTSSGSGFSKRYSYDRCAIINPPPYFPTTGRFQENRYLELDPAGFNHTNYFRSLTPDP